jgi:hypothetical protein
MVKYELFTVKSRPPHGQMHAETRRLELYT